MSLTITYKFECDLCGDVIQMQRFQIATSVIVAGEMPPVPPAGGVICLHTHFCSVCAWPILDAIEKALGERMQALAAGPVSEARAGQDHGAP